MKDSIYREDAIKELIKLEDEYRKYNWRYHPEAEHAYYVVDKCMGIIYNIPSINHDKNKTSNQCFYNK